MSHATPRTEDTFRKVTAVDCFHLRGRTLTLTFFNKLSQSVRCDAETTIDINHFLQGKFIFENKTNPDCPKVS